MAFLRGRGKCSSAGIFGAVFDELLGEVEESWLGRGGEGTCQVGHKVAGVWVRSMLEQLLSELLLLVLALTLLSFDHSCINVSPAVSKSWLTSRPPRATEILKASGYSMT